MPDVTFDHAIDVVVDAVENSGINLRDHEITILRDLNGRLRLHVSRPDGEWPQGAKATLKQRLATAAPYATDVVYLGVRGKNTPEFPLVEQLQAERRIFIPSTPRNDHLPKWFLFDRRFSKDSWLQETGRPQEPWAFGQGPVVVSFFGFKGGVGRTTALAAVALYLADLGKSVVAVDLDLEAPGLPTLLAGEEIEVDLGVVDFLLEEKLERPQALSLSRFYITSPFVEGNGSLRVFPAGQLNQYYIEKLGRIDVQGLVKPEHSIRHLLQRLLGRIRVELSPDMILLDVRAGLHDLGGVSLAGLSHLELIFAVHSQQSWAGLPLILQHLGRLRADWVKLVHTLVPPASRGGDEAQTEFISRAYELCSEFYYTADDLPGPQDESAAHWAYRLSFREALMGLSDLRMSRSDLLSDEHRIFCEQLAKDIGLGE